MSEQKIWVEKMPESCSKCLFCYDNRPYWKSTDCIINHKELDEDEIEIKREKDCPLIDIKTHDRELVKEVCEKIREYLRTQVIYCGGKATELDIMIASAGNQVLEDIKQFLDQIQEEVEK